VFFGYKNQKAKDRVRVHTLQEASSLLSASPISWALYNNLTCTSQSSTVSVQDRNTWPSAVGDGFCIGLRSWELIEWTRVSSLEIPRIFTASKDLLPC